MTDALERLIEAVAAGSIRSQFDASFERAIYPQTDAMSTVYLAGEAYCGSMDAALTLLSSLLPDHDWGRAPGGQMWVQRPPAAPVWSGDGYPPARGLLLAILRAYAAEVSADAPAARPTQPAT